MIRHRHLNQAHTDLHVVLRLDAGPGIGMGHAVRCAGLIEQLEVPHRLTVLGRGDALAGAFPTARIIDIGDEELTAWRTIIEADPPTLVIIDHPRLDVASAPLIRHATRAAIVIIDDEGGRFDADLVVNGTVLERYHRYEGLRPDAQRLLGTRYTLLRAPFGETKWTTNGQGVIAVVGSGLRAEDWALSLATPEFVPDAWRLTIVVGNAFSRLDALKATCARSGVAWRQGLDARALAQAMSRAAVALITGGMIVYEAMAVGVPAVVYPQIDNLVPEARWLAARGAIRDLGPGGGMSRGAVVEAVESLLSDPAERSSMSNIARGLVDGAGAARVATAIRALVEAPSSR